MPTPGQDYIPGVCNLGGIERKMRLVVGWLGLVATVLLLGILIASGAAPIYRLALFLPATLSALGFLQARHRFCVHYGLAGLANTGPALRQTTSVLEAESRRQDRNTSIKIVIQSLAIGLATATIASLIAV